MNKFRVVLRFVSLSFLVLATLAPAQGPASEVGTLQGVVTDSRGAPRAGASVVIQYWRKLDERGMDRVAVYEPAVYTGSEGQFSVQLRPETYEVFIAHLTLSPFAKKIKIEPGKETWLKCKLRPAGVTITLAPSPISAPETGSLKDVVSDEYGAVVPRASILIQHWIRLDEGKPHWVPVSEPAAYTDAEGRFSIQLVAGVYDVFVSTPGLSPFAKKIKIKARKVTKLDSKLRCDPAFCEVVY